MKKSFFLFTLLIFVCNYVFAQDLKKYDVFINNNFLEFIKHFEINNLNNFKLSFEADINLKESSIKHHEFDSKYWDDYITTYKPFIQFSPDSNYFIDLICSSIAIEKREGKFYGSADADQGITLGNIKKKSTFLLAFTGPSGSFTEAKWFNNEIVIIIGYFDDGRKDIVPNIQIFDIKNNKRFFYESKKDVTKAGYKSKLFDKIIFE